MSEIYWNIELKNETYIWLIGRLKRNNNVVLFCINLAVRVGLIGHCSTWVFLFFKINLNK